MDVDLVDAPLGHGPSGEPVYLRDIWPTPQEVAAVVETAIESKMFTASYDSVYEGDARWKQLDVPVRRRLRLGPGVDVRAQASLLRRHEHDAGAPVGCEGGSRAGQAGGQRHH